MSRINSILAILSLTAAFAVNSYAQELSLIKFSDRFVNGALGDDVVIQVSDDSVLMIDESGSPYTLEERNLIIRAKHFHIVGHPIIQSYSANNSAPPKEGTPDAPPKAASYKVEITPLPSLIIKVTQPSEGLKGKVGSAGIVGRKAGFVVLDVAELRHDLSANLVVDMRGQKGGKGQKGGQGGTGGDGGAGGSADGLPCGKPCPDRGLVGAKGGKSGAGGIGGTGGAGGTIYISKNLHSQLGNSALPFTLTAEGGVPGDSGDSGEPGIGGNGGPRGSGSSHCVCNNPPGPGPNGPLGDKIPDPTPMGVTGPNGKILPL